MKTILKIALVVGYFIGLCATIILGVYLLAMACFVIQDKGDTGVIAYTPRWIFWLTPLLFLGMTRTIKHLVGKVNDLVDTLLDFEGRAQRRRANLPWWEK